MATQKKREKSEEILERKTKKIEKAKKERKMKTIKKILKIIIYIIVICVCVAFILSDRWLLAVRDHEPQYIMICYTLYILLEFVMMQLFMSRPNYKSRRHGYYFPKFLVHSALVVLLSLFLGGITRVIANVFYIELVVISVNVFLLESIFYIWENDLFNRGEGKYKSEMKKEIFRKIVYVCFEILFVYLLVESHFPRENLVDFEKLI